MTEQSNKRLSNCNHLLKSPHTKRNSRLKRRWVVKVSRVKLENEDGSLVYAVVIDQKEAKVDAGNGKVIYTEALNHKDKKTEDFHPRSSVQVTEAPSSDGDGEINDDD